MLVSGRVPFSVKVVSKFGDFFLTSEELGRKPEYVSEWIRIRIPISSTCCWSHIMFLGLFENGFVGAKLLRNMGCC